MKAQRDVISEISEDNIMRHVKKIIENGPRPDGTQADLLSVNYIASTLVESGAEVFRDRVDLCVVNKTASTIYAEKPETKEIKCIPNLRSGLTPEEGVSGELEFVGVGTEVNYHGKNVKGKLLLAGESSWFQDHIHCLDKTRIATEKGAKGFIHSTKRDDDLITPWGLYRYCSDIPSVAIPYPDFLFLKELTRKGKVKVWMKVSGDREIGYSEVVSAFIRGNEKPDELVVLVGSHHETVNDCPGANDNASGIAIMLELARVFAKHPLKRSLLFLSTCGEEAGCFGCIEFVEKHRDSLKNAIATIVFDQVGGPESGLFAEGKYRKGFLSEDGRTLRTTPWLNKQIVETARKLGYKLTLFTQPEYTLGGIGDSGPFIRAGIPAVFLCGVISDPLYHTVFDTVDNVDPDALKTIADIIAVVAMDLASA